MLRKLAMSTNGWPAMCEPWVGRACDRLTVPGAHGGHSGRRTRVCITGIPGVVATPTVVSGGTRIWPWVSRVTVTVVVLSSGLLRLSILRSRVLGRILRPCLHGRHGIIRRRDRGGVVVPCRRQLSSKPGHSGIIGLLRIGGVIPGLLCVGR